MGMYQSREERQNITTLFDSGIITQSDWTDNSDAQRYQIAIYDKLPILKKALQPYTNKVNKIFLVVTVMTSDGNNTYEYSTPLIWLEGQTNLAVGTAAQAICFGIMTDNVNTSAGIVYCLVSGSLRSIHIMYPMRFRILAID